MSSTQLNIYAYEIGDLNVVTYVSPRWLTFARHNEAAELTRGAVVGQPLLRFVAGWETCDLYARIFDAVRRREHSVSLPFRCDSPRVRRFMELKIGPGPQGRLRLEGSLMRRERRPYVALLDANLVHSGAWLVICSMCRRVSTDDHEWVEVEEALRLGRNLTQVPLPRLTHSLCSECIATVGSRMQDAGLV